VLIPINSLSFTPSSEKMLITASKNELVLSPPSSENRLLPGIWYVESFQNLPLDEFEEHIRFYLVMRWIARLSLCFHLSFKTNPAISGHPKYRILENPSDLIDGL